MRILVTGGTGFIGSNVLTALSGIADVDVFALTRSHEPHGPGRITWIQADVTASGWTRSLPVDGVDVVLHLSQSRRYREFPAHVSDIYEVNVSSTVALAEWAAKAGVKKFLFASTGNVYGSKDKVLREDDVCEPDSMYGASKLSAEILLKPFFNFFDITVLRLFGVYGPGQKNSMIPGIIQRFIDGAEITLAGNFGIKFTPIFIEDCVAVIVRLINKKLTSSFEILNVGGEQIVDIKNVVSELEAFSGRRANTCITSDMPKFLICSNEKLLTVTDWRQKISFHDGLRETFDDFIRKKRAKLSDF